MGGRVISFDTETYYDAECSVKTLGPAQYCAHPKWNCYLVSVCDGEETWVGHPDHFNWAALEGATIVSHNAHFDRTVYQRMVELGQAPRVAYKDWVCSANLTSYLSNRRSLAQAVEHHFHAPVAKDLRDWMKGRSWADAVALGKDKPLLEYAKRDALWCWRLWNELSDQWPEWERKLSDLTIRSGMRGVLIDRELLARYIEACEWELIDIEEMLLWTKHGAAPTSSIAIAEECKRVGIPAPSVMSRDEEAFEAWEAKHAPFYPWIKAVRRWRSVNKVLKGLRTIRERIRPDGSVETLLKYFGSHTGRWSGDGGINFQNLNKTPLLCHGVDVDVRRLIIPRGKMIVADLSQIEPRVLAWLTQNWELLNAMQGRSVYDAFARAQGGWTGPDLKKADPERYQMTKIQVLGLGYQCGWEKFITIAAGYGVELDEQRSREMVETFRAQNPKIVDLWHKLDRAFKLSVGDGEFAVELPSGRKLTYRKLRRDWKLHTDPETGKTCRDSVVTAEIVKSGRLVSAPLYGGLLAENITQAVAREVFAEHLLGMDAQGWDIPFHVHDEAVLDVPNGVQVRDVEHVMSKCPVWLPACPIAAEGYETPHYTKR